MLLGLCPLHINSFSLHIYLDKRGMDSGHARQVARAEVTYSCHISSQTPSCGPPFPGAVSERPSVCSQHGPVSSLNPSLHSPASFGRQFTHASGTFCAPFSCWLLVPRDSSVIFSSCVCSIWVPLRTRLPLPPQPPASGSTEAGSTAWHTARLR